MEPGAEAAAYRLSNQQAGFEDCQPVFVSASFVVCVRIDGFLRFFREQAQ